MYSLTTIIKTISLIALTLGCFGLSPQARAVDPPPDGGYANQNTAEGQDALLSLTTGSDNTAMGFEALLNTTYGSLNTAVGMGTLSNLTTGLFNTAIGSFALGGFTTGQSNTAIGVAALGSSGSGAVGNTAVGSDALGANKGSNNIALGSSAGFNLTTGNNNIDIGAAGAAGESNTMRLGHYGVQKNTYIAGVSGATVPDGVTVIINSLGHLGTINSSARYKEAIKPMDRASEAILALQPVTFHYKKELDPAAIPQFGLVAEQVEKVNPDLVARDEEGKPYTVRYEAVNAMLLNEFLKEHRKVETLEAKVAKLQATIEKMSAPGD